MYSFDVYDTLITRCTASPYGVFLIMQERLRNGNVQCNYSKYLIENFVTLRVKSEKIAKRFPGKNTVCLQDIYEVLEQMTSIPAETAKEIMQLEIRTEIDCAVGIEENIQKVIELRDKNEHVVLISDMYLQSSDMKKILKKVNMVFADIPLYVSGEYGCTKQDGLLYVQVRELEEAAYKCWTHYGNNYMSDVCVPSVLGINGILVNSNPETIWEKEMRNHMDLKSNLSLQITLGVIKIIQMKNTLNDREKMGVSLGGIILYPYVEWIIMQSVQLGVDRLYFIARDGYILKKIADVYIEEKDLKISTKYIYGSRSAWRVDEEDKRKQVLEYLLQEADFSNENYAFVDSRGSGRSMVYLSEILDGHTCGELKVFYYEMLDKQKEKSHCKFMIYSICRKGAILETFCRAPHGMTVGYEIANGRYIPKLTEINNQKWENSGLDDYFRGIELFAKEMAHITSFLSCDITIDCLGDFLLEYCVNNPDKEILNFICELPHDGTGLNEEKTYARRLSKKEIFQIFMWSTSETASQYYDGSDFEFAKLRMNSQERKLAEFYYKNYDRILGKLIHIYKKIYTRVTLGNRGHEGKKRVIVYAAGRRGKRLYNQIRITPGIKVVGWTDLDYRKYQKLGYPVKALSDVVNLDYDLLVISIVDKRETEIVKQLLTAAGIDPERIMGREEFYEKYL